MFFNILKAELNKELKYFLRFKLEWVGEVIALVLFYYFLSQIQFFQRDISLNIFFMGYCIWLYSIFLIGDISSKISSDLNSGMYQNVYFCVIPTTVFYLIRLASTIIKSIFMMSILFLFLKTTFNLKIELLDFIRLFISMILITPPLIGISYFLSGIVIYYKKASFLKNILNNSLLFFSGIFFPITLFPESLQWVACFLPTKQGFDFFVHTKSETFFILFTMSIIYLILGLKIYTFFERKAFEKGFGN